MDFYTTAGESRVWAGCEVDPGSKVGVGGGGGEG